MTTRAGSLPPFVAIYADESCLGNGLEGRNPGGAAGVIEYWNTHSRQLSRFDYWISEPATTNNRMALRSVIDGFRILGRKGGRFRVVFVSDSQYLVRGMRDWVYGWMTRGWRRKAGVIENLELWKNAVEVTRQHQVDWRWVRGHEGHPQNEYANFLAMRAARDLSDSGGPVPSEFDSWLARERLGGRMAAEPDPFPLERDFKPARPLPVVTNTLLTS